MIDESVFMLYYTVLCEMIPRPYILEFYIIGRFIYLSLTFHLSTSFCLKLIIGLLFFVYTKTNSVAAMIRPIYPILTASLDPDNLK